MCLVFIEINNFHFKNDQVLDKILIFANEDCYISTSGKDLWWGCTRVQKLCFSLADVPENRRKWEIFYCCGHKVKRQCKKKRKIIVYWMKFYSFCLKLLE